MKFSVFRYRYEVLDPFVDADGVQLASIRDLAAMKLTALIGRAPLPCLSSTFVGIACLVMLALLHWSDKAGVPPLPRA